MLLRTITYYFDSRKVKRVIFLRVLATVFLEIKLTISPSCRFTEKLFRYANY